MGNGNSKIDTNTYLLYCTKQVIRVKKLLGYHHHNGVTWGSIAHLKEPLLKLLHLAEPLHLTLKFVNFFMQYKS